MPEPERKNGQNIEKSDRAGGVAGPDDPTVDAPVAQQADHGRKQRQNSQHKQNAGAVDILRTDAPVRREGRIGEGARKLRMENGRAAERALLFAVGKLRAAFYTIHCGSSLITLVALDLDVQAEAVQHTEEVKLQLRLTDVADEVDIHGIAPREHAAVMRRA